MIKDDAGVVIEANEQEMLNITIDESLIGNLDILVRLLQNYHDKIMEKLIKPKEVIMDKH